MAALIAEFRTSIEVLEAQNQLSTNNSSAPTQSALVNDRSTNDNNIDILRGSRHERMATTTNQVSQTSET